LEAVDPAELAVILEDEAESRQGVLFRLGSISGVTTMCR
jgi:hypothetical protein